MNIIASSEEQKLKLETYYQEMLSKHNLVDHMSIEKNRRIDDMTRWPVISLWNIFAYILDKKCATRNIFDTIRTKKHIHIGIVDSLFIEMNKFVLGTKVQRKKVVPKRIADLFVRLASLENTK